MNIKRNAILAILGVCLMVATPVFAQTPRPTPTNVPTSQSEPRGGIFGAVYVDVNGDGICVDSGVEGEVPVEGITVQFTSSNATTTLSLQTGANGTYGLVAAGESFWEVLVIPEADMHITSENPQYVPVYHDGILEHSGINFCISTGANAVIVRNGNSTTSATATNGIILVPEAGAPARQPQSGFIWFVTAVSIGVAFFFFGLLVEWKRRRNQITH